MLVKVEQGVAATWDAAMVPGAERVPNAGADSDPE